MVEAQRRMVARAHVRAASFSASRLTRACKASAPRRMPCPELSRGRWCAQCRSMVGETAASALARCMSPRGRCGGVGERDRARYAPGTIACRGGRSRVDFSLTDCCSNRTKHRKNTVSAGICYLPYTRSIALGRNWGGLSLVGLPDHDRARPRARTMTSRRSAAGHGMLQIRGIRCSRRRVSA